MKKIIVCKTCGQECERVSNAQKYCEKCAPTRYPRTIKPKKIKSISELNAEARAVGMTYGQYVATLRQ